MLNCGESVELGYSPQVGSGHMNETGKITLCVSYSRRPTPRFLRWRRGEQPRALPPGMPPRVGLPGTVHMAFWLGVGFLRGRRASYTAGLPLLWVRRSPCRLLGRGIKTAPREDPAARLPRTGRWWRKTPTPSKPECWACRGGL